MYPESDTSIWKSHKNLMSKKRRVSLDNELTEEHFSERMTELMKLHTKTIKLKEGSPESIASHDECIELCETLLMYPAKIIERPWNVYLQRWEGVPSIYEDAYTAELGLREEIVVCATAMNRSDLVSTHCDHILKGNGYPIASLSLAIANKLQCLIDAEHITEMMDFLREVETSPNFKDVRTSSNDHTFYNVTLARAYFATDTYAKKALHHAQIATGNGAKSQLSAPEDKYWCDFVTCYCSPPQTDTIKLREHISRWRELLSIPSEIAPHAHDRYLTWLLAYEEVCTDEEYYGIIMEELKWLTLKPDSQLNNSTVIFLKAKRRVSIYDATRGKCKVDRVVDASLIGNEARFVNHSDDPNCYLDANPSIIALKTIAANEELTVNYGNLFWEAMDQGIFEVSKSDGLFEFCSEVIDEPYGGMNHVFALARVATSNIRCTNARNEPCPVGHPAFPGMRLMASKAFQPGDRIIVYAGVRSVKPEAFACLYPNPFTVRTNTGVSIGAFGFLLQPGKPLYQEVQKLPAIACITSKKAGDLRDWAAPADLQGIKQIEGLSTEATAALLKMLVNEKKFNRLKRWLTHYRNDLTKLREKLLRVKKKGFSWDLTKLSRIPDRGVDTRESDGSDEDSEVEANMLYPADGSAPAVAMQRPSWRAMMVD